MILSRQPCGEAFGLCHSHFSSMAQSAAFLYRAHTSLWVPPLLGGVSGVDVGEGRKHPHGAGVCGQKHLESIIKLSLW